jgi:D-3-phosphoglycerate dehydrogenase
MIGRVGTMFGKHGVNIASAAVGRQPGTDPSDNAGPGSGLAVMIVTVDSPVPAEVLEEILGLEGFQDGRAVVL